MPRVNTVSHPVVAGERQGPRTGGGEIVLDALGWFTFEKEKERVVLVVEVRLAIATVLGQPAIRCTPFPGPALGLPRGSAHVVLSRLSQGGCRCQMEL